MLTGRLNQRDSAELQCSTGGHLGSEVMVQTECLELSCGLSGCAAGLTAFWFGGSVSLCVFVNDPDQFSWL
jgi:hypothetical protein